MVWKKPFYSTDLSVGVKILSGAEIFFLPVGKCCAFQKQHAVLSVHRIAALDFFTGVIQ